jgi:hypothetical protein
MCTVNCEQYLSDSDYDRALSAATDIGVQEGTAAASWFFDGNTPDDTYRTVLAGIDNGDPAVLDTLPSADLSGQWADGRTPDTLRADVATALGIPADTLLSGDAMTGIMDAYETAFNDTVAGEIETMARTHLAGTWTVRI